MSRLSGLTDKQTKMIAETCVRATQTLLQRLYHYRETEQYLHRYDRQTKNLFLAVFCSCSTIVLPHTSHPEHNTKYTSNSGDLHSLTSNPI